MGMAAHDGVYTTHTTRHLQVDIHSVMRQKDYDLRTFCAHFVHHLLHVFILDAECPVCNHIAWISNRRVWKRLTDDGARHAVHFTHDIRFKDLIAKVLCFDILRNELNFSGKVFLNNFFDAVHTVGEFPMAGHHIDTQQLTRVDHVLRIRPQRCGRALPCVAAV